jgi:hypothetical protein
MFQGFHWIVKTGDQWHSLVRKDLEAGEDKLHEDLRTLASYGL